MNHIAINKSIHDALVTYQSLRKHSQHKKLKKHRLICATIRNTIMPCRTCKKAGHNAKSCPMKNVESAVPEQALAGGGPPPTAAPKKKKGQAVVLTADTSPDPPDTPDIAKIRAYAIEILATLGAGHTESVYQNALKIAIGDEGLKFESERDIIITFRGRYVGTVRADIIVEQRLVIELKATNGKDSAVADAEEQCRCYMKETKISSGLVVSFPKRVGGQLTIKAVSIDEN